LSLELPGFGAIALAMLRPFFLPFPLPDFLLFACNRPVFSLTSVFLAFWFSFLSCSCFLNGDEVIISACSEALFFAVFDFDTGLGLGDTSFRGKVGVCGTSLLVEE
jgi:hypothetical protein